MKGDVGEMAEKGDFQISDFGLSAGTVADFFAGPFDEGFFIEQDITSYKKPGQQKQGE